MSENITVDVVALDHLSRTGTSAAHMIEHHVEHMARVAAGKCGCIFGLDGLTAMQGNDGTVLIISEPKPGQFAISGHRAEAMA